MSQAVTAVKGKNFLLPWLGVTALGLATLASVGVLVALGSIFLWRHPALQAPAAVMYAMIGIALGTLVVSGITTLIIFKMRHAAPALVTDVNTPETPQEKSVSSALTAQQQLFRIAGVGVTLLALVTSALVLIAPFRAPCVGPFSDTFHGTYDACWTWEHPGGGSITPQADGLRMVGAPGGDFYYKNLNAPHLVQPISDPNFTIETSLTYATVRYGDYQGAGLLLWQDSQHYVRLEFGNFGGLSSQGIGFGIMNNGNYQRIVDTTGALDTNLSVALRLERTGDTMIAWWRDNDAGPWFALGTGKIHLDHIQAGIIVAVGAEATFPPAAVFHRFTVILPKP